VVACPGEQRLNGGRRFPVGGGLRLLLQARASLAGGASEPAGQALPEERGGKGGAAGLEARRARAGRGRRSQQARPWPKEEEGREKKRREEKKRKGEKKTKKEKRKRKKRKREIGRGKELENGKENREEF
jgi:hypothetical protein